MITLVLGVILGASLWAFVTGDDREEQAASFLVVCAVLVAIAIHGVSVAGASRFNPPAGTQRSSALDVYQRWLDASKVDAPDDITIALQPCDKISSTCVRKGTSGYYIRYPDYAYVTDYGPSQTLLVRMGLMHEVGHIAFLNDRRLRLEVTRALGYELIGPDADEHTADVYALCSVFGRSYPPKSAFRYTYGHRTPKTAYHRACDILT